MKIIFTSELAVQDALQISNDADPLAMQDAITQAPIVTLHFPKFTDGRAYSQAMLIRQRLGFKGDLRATGDVLVDQLQLMQRTGFSSVVLRDDQSKEVAQRMLALFQEFYQGDVQTPPRFAVKELA